MTTRAKMIPYVRTANLKNCTPFQGTYHYGPYIWKLPSPPTPGFPMVSWIFIFLRKLDSLLKPDKKRADELKKEFAKGFNGIVKRIWPHVNLVLACSTGI